MLEGHLALVSTLQRGGRSGSLGRVAFLLGMVREQARELPVSASLILL